MPENSKINRRSFLAAGLLAPLAKRPNVLFFAVDDLRPQLGCYGDRFARTPHIDSIAAAGMVFQRAYCQQALCGPSRASLLTGLRPDTTGVYDLATRFRDKVPDAVTLPELFRKNGYHTENIGKIFHGAEVMLDAQSWSVPERLHMVTKRDQYALAANKTGADDWAKTSSTEIADVPDEAYIDGRIANDAVQALGRLKDKPFFLAVGFNKPHLPFAAPKKYWDRFDRAELPLPTATGRPQDVPPQAFQAYSELRSYDDVPDTGVIPEAKIREVIHGYYAATAYTDDNVGKVLAALRRYNLQDNTIVILWGDHGWHLGELDYWGKTTNFEICVRAPLIVSDPRQPKRVGSTSKLVEFVDIYPTLAELCGLKAPARLEGTSFVPLLDRPARPWKKAAFSQYPRDQKKPNQSMGYSMRTERYRYTEWRSMSQTAVARELYDHQTDAMETRNIAGKDEALTAKLAKALQSGWRAALPCLLALASLLSPAQAQTHKPEALLADTKLLTDPKALPVLPAKTSSVYRAQQGEWQFNLHSYLAWHQGEFWAVWSSGRVDEDSGNQVVRYARSKDGHQWSQSQVLVEDPDGPDKPGLWITRGIYSEGGKLYALAAYGEGKFATPKGNESWHNLRLVRFEWTGSTWANRGTFVENCMNNYPPRKLGDGWFMTCRDSFAWMHTARSDAAGTAWTVTRLPGDPPHDRMSEPSWYVDDAGVAHLIFRDGRSSKWLYHSTSTDQGRTWTAPVRTNYPDATSKNIAGRLSNGRYFLINNPNQKGRDPLAISFSSDGWTFSDARLLRLQPPPQRYPGRAKAPNSFQYPHVLEKDGSLWVIYSTNKEDIDISEFRIADFPRDPAQLLADPKLLSDTANLPLVKAEHTTVFRGEAAVSGFNLHSYIAHYKGMFYAIWSSSRVGEEDPDQLIRYATSRDAKTWSTAKVLADDPDGPENPARWIARGVYVESDKLYALGAYIESADYRKRGQDEVWKNLKLMRWEWTGKTWKSLGVFAENCMNNFPPSRLGGLYGMPCRDSRMDVFMAAADAPGPKAWSRTPLTADPPFHKMDEPTLYQAKDGSTHMIVRDNNRSGKLIRSISLDQGKTWSQPVLTNFPDATSKNFTGRLSNGWYYLINNPNPKGRDPLAIALSPDGWQYTRAYAIRKSPPARRVAGRAKGSGSMQYPHALEQAGVLHVIYSTNKEDIEIASIRIGDLGIQ